MLGSKRVVVGAWCHFSFREAIEVTFATIMAHTPKIRQALNLPQWGEDYMANLGFYLFISPSSNMYESGSGEAHSQSHALSLFRHSLHESRSDVIRPLQAHWLLQLLCFPISWAFG